MSRDLHNDFPEYKRKKFRVFQGNVETNFEQMKNSNKKHSKDSPQTISSDSEDDKNPDKERNESIVKGLSLNKTISQMYSKPSQNSTVILDHGRTNGSKVRKIDLAQDFSNVANLSKKGSISSPLINASPKNISFRRTSEEAEMIDLSNDDTSSNQSQTSHFIVSTPAANGELQNSRLTNNITPSAKSNNHQSSTQSVSKSQTSILAQTPGKQKIKGITKKQIGVVESKVTFADIGGMDSTLVKVLDLLLHLKHPEIYQHIGVTPPRGFLLHGPPGCGKTLLANAIAGQLKLPLIKLAATEIVSGVSGESESKLRDLFDQAMSNAPCILFIDEIDAITQRRDNAQKGMESRIVGQLLACMDELNEKGNDKEGHVVVIGATNRPDTLDPALRRAGRFEREISMGIPDEQSRVAILKVMTAKLNLETNFSLEALARKCPGYVGADMSSLCREAATLAVNRILKDLQCTSNVPYKNDPNHESSIDKLTFLLNWLNNTAPLSEEQLSSVSIAITDFDAALKVVQPSAKREGFATVPGVTWDDIGALNDVRDELELSILAPVNHPEITKALGLESPSGILLCGPPGCGKTLLAKAVANQAGINFISVKGPELLNMYVGESERAVRQVFQRARNSAPCVIFFDEIDALCPKRSASSGGENSARVVNQLLTEMDGLESRGQGVFVMGATNRVDILDPAVLRPGRLQKILFVDLPSPSDRVDILRAITRHGTRPKLATDVDFDALAHSEECEFFTGADMAALVTEASNASFKEHILLASRRGKQNAELTSNIDIKVSAKHFRSAFSKVRPSVSLKDRTKYQEQKKLYATSKPVEAADSALNTLSCDEEDEIGSDRIIPSDRERSLSQVPFNGISNAMSHGENEFSTKDPVESDTYEMDENDQEQVAERLENEPIQVECDSSPSILALQDAHEVDALSSQTPSPSFDNK